MWILLEILFSCQWWKNFLKSVEIYRSYHPRLSGEVFGGGHSVVHLLLCCWQNASTNGRCLTDGRRATSTRSFLPNHSVQASVVNGTGTSVGSAVHSTKPSVLPLHQPVCCASAVSSVTTTSTVNTQLPTPAVKPQQPSVAPSICTSTPATRHTGQLLGILN